MRQSRQVFRLSLLLWGMLFTACSTHRPIGTITADPGRYQNQEVAVAGKVTESYGVLGTGMYELDDGTGKIWIVTSRGVPLSGAHVDATGRLHTVFSLRGRSFGTVLEEADRRAR